MRGRRCDIQITVQSWWHIHLAEPGHQHSYNKLPHELPTYACSLLAVSRDAVEVGRAHQRCKLTPTNSDRHRNRNAELRILSRDEEEVGRAQQRCKHTSGVVSFGRRQKKLGVDGHQQQMDGQRQIQTSERKYPDRYVPTICHHTV